MKTPLGKLGFTKGRPLPEHFELSLLATGKRFHRTVDGQGRISWKRYRLYVRVELRQQRVEIREFFDSFVVSYQSGSVVSYECIHESHGMVSVENTPIFHEHPGIKASPQLELFDFSQRQLRYVARRPPYRKRRKTSIDAIQLLIDALVD